MVTHSVVALRNVCVRPVFVPELYIFILEIISRSIFKDFINLQKPNETEMEKKKRKYFMESLILYMDKKENPHRRILPQISTITIDVFSLYSLIQKYGSFKEVCLKNHWKSIAKLMFKSKNTDASEISFVRRTFTNYLSKFLEEEFFEIY